MTQIIDDQGGVTPSVPTGSSTYALLLAWAVVLVLVGLANRTQFGHNTLYYLLALMLLFLLVTQYRWFARVLQPITG